MTLLPVIPIYNSMLFPGISAPLTLGRQKSVACALTTWNAPERKVAIFVQRRDCEQPQADDLYPLGTSGTLHSFKGNNRGVEIVVRATERVRLLEIVATEPILQARVEVIPLPTDSGVAVEALERAVLALAQKIAPTGGLAAFDITALQATPTQYKAFCLASTLRLSSDKEQQLLQSETNEEALQLLLSFLNYELQVREIQQRVEAASKVQLEQTDKEKVWRQQVAVLQKELGEDKNSEAEIRAFRERVLQCKLPPRPEEEALRQLKLLERMPPAAAEYQVSQTYLELILELPWNSSTEQVLELTRARQILNEDHFGLLQVKERILEYLAVMQRNPEAHAPILCFIGPPGTGKTSLGKSIARALGRKFERLSLGGVHDEAELRGHRRTYVGAMTGRILQALRRASVNNPVMMLDEVDKLRRSFEGDPAAALLEVLDPAQNREFRDNYLDLPFDLSKVFFITTANSVDNIPAPLLDRLEVIHLSGYTQEEKLQIGLRYLLPRELSDAGLLPQHLTIPDETIASLISHYTREAGVRQLNRILARVCRRVVLGLAENSPLPERFTSAAVEELLGPEGFMVDLARAKLDPGVVAGLAWTEAGGEVIYVEVGLLSEGMELVLTGSLGEVMKESARAAHSYIETKAAALGLDHAPSCRSVHIHVPSGATPKDGPSAGLAMACALVSAYTGLSARADTAMTGEITLSGLVLPIGGVKEKLLAAQRAGLKRILLPRLNAKDLEDLPASLHQETDIILVDRIEQALPHAISGFAQRPSRANVPHSKAD